MMTIRQVINFSLHMSLLIDIIIIILKISFLFFFSGFGYFIILSSISSSRNNYRHYWNFTSIWFGIFTNIL